MCAGACRIRAGLTGIGRKVLESADFLARDDAGDRTRATMHVPVRIEEGMRSLVAGFAAAVLATVGLTSPLGQSLTGRPAEASRPYTTWSSYLGSADSAQYTSLAQITRANVSRLQVAWTFPSGSRTFLFNPLVANGLVFVLAGANDLVALDATA